MLFALSCALSNILCTGSFMVQLWLHFTNKIDWSGLYINSAATVTVYTLPFPVAKWPVVLVETAMIIYKWLHEGSSMSYSSMSNNGGFHFGFLLCNPAIMLFMGWSFSACTSFFSMDHCIMLPFLLDAVNEIPSNNFLLLGIMSILCT